MQMHGQGDGEEETPSWAAVVVNPNRAAVRRKSSSHRSRTPLVDHGELLDVDALGAKRRAAQSAHGQGSSMIADVLGEQLRDEAVCQGKLVLGAIEAPLIAPTKMADQSSPDTRGRKPPDTLQVRPWRIARDHRAPAATAARSR